MRSAARFAKIFVLAFGAALAAAPASASGPAKHGSAHHAHEKRAARATHDAKRGRAASIGAPNSGKLEGAARLRGSRSLVQRKNAHSWGLPQLVKLLHRAAANVARHHRGSVLFVADLSAREGGPLVGHNSHQSGRDADVAFYVTSSKGKPIATKRFIAFGGDGHPKTGGSVRFDDARNWDFVQALLQDRKAHVRYIFVSNPLKARLLDYARHKGASKDLLLRAAQALLSPDHADIHDDHFHVRISCPESMHDTCIEESVARGGAAKDDDSASESTGAKEDASAASDDEGDADAAPAKNDAKTPAKDDDASDKGSGGSADAPAGAKAAPAPAPSGTATP